MLKSYLFGVLSVAMNLNIENPHSKIDVVNHYEYEQGRKDALEFIGLGLHPLPDLAENQPDEGAPPRYTQSLSEAGLVSTPPPADVQIHKGPDPVETMF